MSFWYQPKLQDIHPSLDGKDIEMQLGNNEGW